VNPPEVLERARHLAQPALRKAVGTLHPRLRAPAEYHFGWVDADGTPNERGGGKAVRPALVVLGAEAAGGAPEAAVAGAVALELAHNFSLVHDDIMDGDRTRRHRPTVWDLYGVPDAILVGDALHTLAFQVLLEDANERARVAVDHLSAAIAAMIAGQAQDTALDAHAEPVGAIEVCEAMHAGKTSALLRASVVVGSVLAGAGSDVVDALGQYGTELGLSFQAIVDLLGIWGDPEVTGKPAGNDLRERKRSLPVAIALEAGGTLADRLLAAFAGEPDAATIDAIATEMAASGIDAAVEARAQAHLQVALDALDRVELDPVARHGLHELAHFVCERRY
jgi:geranylgeranyl diphosphate synthase type I